MLRCVPRAPRKRANREIRDQLLELGFDVGIRTIQRDLRRLSALFPIASDDHKPLGWSWTGTASFDLPGMDVHTAIAFRLAARYLEPLLPRATQAYLEPHFLRAAEVLDGMSARGLSAWPAKIRAIPWGFALQPPQIEQPVLEGVHEGLLKDRVLAVAYRRRGETGVRQYEAHASSSGSWSVSMDLIEAVRTGRDGARMSIGERQVPQKLFFCGQDEEPGGGGTRRLRRRRGVQVQAEGGAQASATSATSVPPREDRVETMPPALMR
jgi:hypothetical protein